MQRHLHVLRETNFVLSFEYLYISYYYYFTKCSCVMIFAIWLVWRPPHQRKMHREAIKKREDLKTNVDQPWTLSVEKNVTPAL